jgi:hypothetical protein
MKRSLIFYLTFNFEAFMRRRGPMSCQRVVDLGDVTKHTGLPPTLLLLGFTQKNLPRNWILYIQCNNATSHHSYCSISRLEGCCRKFSGVFRFLREKNLCQVGNLQNIHNEFPHMSKADITNQAWYSVKPNASLSPGSCSVQNLSQLLLYWH